MKGDRREREERQEEEERHERGAGQETSDAEAAGGANASLESLACEMKALHKKVVMILTEKFN